MWIDNYQTYLFLSHIDRVVKINALIAKVFFTVFHTLCNKVNMLWSKYELKHKTEVKSYYVKTELTNVDSELRGMLFSPVVNDN